MTVTAETRFPVGPSKTPTRPSSRAIDNLIHLPESKNGGLRGLVFSFTILPFSLLFLQTDSSLLRLAQSDKDTYIPYPQTGP
jgi:hypothetical protein